MVIALNEHVSHVRITANEKPIDAHWNYYNDVDEAKEGFKNIVQVPGVIYGFLTIEKVLFDIVG